MKYQDIHQAGVEQANLRTRLASLTKFRDMLFGDQHKLLREKAVRVQIWVGNNYQDMSLDSEDQIFLDIEKRMLWDVRETIGRLRRLGVSITFEEVLPNG